MIDLQEILEKIQPFVLGWAHPNWQNWTPTLTGWSSDPTNAVYRYLLMGKIFFFTIRQLTPGVSSSGTTSLTIPFTPATITNQVWVTTCIYEDNGIPAATFGRAIIGSGVNSIVFGIDAKTSGGFTPTGNKRIAACDGFCEIA